jgi:hypothetical protein
MQSIVDNNRAALLDPVGTRVVRIQFLNRPTQLTRMQWSGWVVQQYNSGAIAMGAFGEDLFTYGKPYWLVPFATFIGLFCPIPFWLIYRYSKPDSWAARVAKYINTPIILLYIGASSSPRFLQRSKY